MRKLISWTSICSRRAGGHTVAAFAIAIGVATPALAQDNAEPVRQAIIGFDFAGCDELFPDPNDAGLKRAVHMIPDRIKEFLETPEVAREMDDPFPRPVLYALLDNLGGPMRMIFTQRGFDQQTGQPRLGAVLSLHVDDEDAIKHMHAEIERLRHRATEEGGEQGLVVNPSERFPGMMDVQAPFGIVSYGPRESADGWRYEIIYGDIPDADGVFDLLPEAAMKGSVCRGVVDFTAASPFTSMLAGMANMGGPEAGMLVDWLKSMGLLGPEAISAEWEFGYPGDYAQEVWRIRRAGHYADGLGLSREVVSREDLAALPVDASFFSIKKMDPQREFAKVKEMLIGLGGAEEWDEITGELREVLGIDVEQDFINALGKTGAFYFADSTGGGSLLSAVMLIELSNPRTMIETMNTLAARLNAAIAEEVETEVISIKADKYIRDGIPYMEMRVRGAPVPSIPTMAVVGNWLVIAPTPQGCAAAAAQARGHDGTSALRSRALSALGIRGGAATEMTIIDPARTLRDGYSVTALLCGMLENAVRSPNSERDPGSVLPTYNQLIADARPISIIGKWDGEDYLFTTTGDRSSLVNAAAMLGVGDVGEVLLGAVVGGGIAAGACKEAMEHRDYDWDDDDDDDHHHHDHDDDDHDWDDTEE